MTKLITKPPNEQRIVPMPSHYTPRPGTPPTPDTAFPSMGPKWTARRFVIDPPDDERGPDMGLFPLRLHMHVCGMYMYAKLIIRTVSRMSGATRMQPPGG